MWHVALTFHLTAVITTVQGHIAKQNATHNVTGPAGESANLLFTSQDLCYIAVLSCMAR